MRDEIEKKYLIKEDGTDFTNIEFNKICASVSELEEEVMKNGKPVKQGYMSLEKGSDLLTKLGKNIDFEAKEARIRKKGEKYFFTIKGEGTIVRKEFEETLEEHIFEEYWPFTEGKRVEKIRLEKPYKLNTLEIDVYTDRNLIVVEVEFTNILQALEWNPVGIGKDISEDTKYKNKNLAK